MASSLREKCESRASALTARSTSAELDWKGGIHMPYTHVAGQLQFTGATLVRPEGIVTALQLPGE